MKNRKLLLIISLLLVGGLLFCGLRMAGQTWAWPMVAEENREQLAIGTVDCGLRVLRDGQEVSMDAPLEPGSYTVELTATGDADGWFRMWLFASSGDTESRSFRTQQLKPAEQIRFSLELEEPAWLTVESRWDMLDADSELLYDGLEIHWGVPAEDTSEEETEPETEETEPETETTEPETEATEPETETTEPETEATEPETEATEPETEATEPQTESTENE